MKHSSVPVGTNPLLSFSSEIKQNLRYKTKQRPRIFWVSKTPWGVSHPGKAMKHVRKLWLDFFILHFFFSLWDNNRSACSCKKYFRESPYTLYSVSPAVTSCRRIAQGHNQETNINTVNIQNLSITTSIFYDHTHSLPSAPASYLTVGKH